MPGEAAFRINPQTVAAHLAIYPQARFETAHQTLCVLLSSWERMRVRTPQQR